jgi:hypothetical protein
MTEINAENLIDRILLLIGREVSKMERRKNALSNQQARLLTELIRVLLSTKKSEQEDEKEFRKTISNLSQEEVNQLLKEEK